jgi:hypothetical protein
MCLVSLLLTYKSSLSLFFSRKAAEFAKVLIAARRARRQASGCLARLFVPLLTTQQGREPDAQGTLLFQVGSLRIPAPLPLCALGGFA